MFRRSKPFSTGSTRAGLFAMSVLLASLSGAACDAGPDGPGNGGDDTSGGGSGGASARGGSAGSGAATSGAGGAVTGGGGGTAGRGGTTGAGGTTGGGGTAGSAGNDGEGGEGGEPCNELVPSSAPVEYRLLEDEDAPAPLGGEPLEGVYDLTSLVAYGGTPSCFDSYELLDFRYTLHIEPASATSGEFDLTLTYTGTDARSRSSYEVDGSELVTSPLCGEGAIDDRRAFTATDTTFVLIDPEACGTVVFEMTRR